MKRKTIVAIALSGLMTGSAIAQEPLRPLPKIINGKPVASIPMGNEPPQYTTNGIPMISHGPALIPQPQLTPLPAPPNQGAELQRRMKNERK